MFLFLSILKYCALKYNQERSLTFDTSVLWPLHVGLHFAMRAALNKSSITWMTFCFLLHDTDMYALISVNHRTPVVSVHFLSGSATHTQSCMHDTFLQTDNIQQANPASSTLYLLQFSIKKIPCKMFEYVQTVLLFNKAKAKIW